MKTFKLFITGIAVTVLSILSVSAQEKGSGNVVSQERTVGTFDQIKVGCAIKLFLSQGTTQLVRVETDDNFQDNVTSKVTNGTLELNCSKMSNPTKLNVYVTAVKLSKLDASGAAIVKGENTINNDVFGLYSSGASKINLTLITGIFNGETSGAAVNNINLTTNNANTEVSGAANLALSGTADSHKTEVSGAANLKALEFITDKTVAEVSGAANAKVFARKQLKADLSGAGSLSYFDNKDVKKISKNGEYTLNFEGMENIKHVTIEGEDVEKSDDMAETNDPSENDDVSVIIDENKVVVVTDDSVKIKLGNRTFKYDDNGINIQKSKKEAKFKGHWGGFEIGVNGLLNNNNEMNAPAGYQYLDLNYNKSINVNLNFFEQNINLVKNHLGLVTGLGLSWNNYRFDKNVVLTKNSVLGGFYDNNSNLKYEKSKLLVTYLTLPLMLEYQTNSKSKINSFHVSGGVVSGLKIGSHTKLVYEENGDRKKDKESMKTLLNPFKLDAIAKIGWGKLNLYGTYSLVQLFRTNKGPEVYPFSIGICLTDF